MKMHYDSEENYQLLNSARLVINMKKNEIVLLPLIN